MTKNPHDQLAKELLEELLSPLGEVQRSLEIPGESKLVDLWFAPSRDADSPDTDILAKIAQRCCLLEPFRNPPNRADVRSCLLKLLWVQEDIRRKAERRKQTLPEREQPVLWIIGTTIHKPILAEFGAVIHPDFGDGVYCTSSGLGLNFIAINQLPRTRETLILRILGRGRVQQEAVADVFALPIHQPQRSMILRILSSWKFTLELGEAEIDERESMMALSQAFLEWEQATEQKGISKGLEQGLEQGEKSIILRLLNRKVGNLSPQISDRIEALSLEEVEDLGVALLDFNEVEDLVMWLDQH